jgi:hypothetical protein
MSHIEGFVDNKVIMPKATALWLKFNTQLTQEQIANFCNLDLLTLDSLTYESMKSHNPLKSEQLTENEIKKGEKNPNYRLKNCLNIKHILPPKTQRKYIPVFFRKKKPAIIAWFVFKFRDHPAHLELNEKRMQLIAKALSTNLNYVKKYIEEAAASENILKDIVDPIVIGVCTQKEIDIIMNE